MPRIARPPLPAAFRRLLVQQHGVFSVDQATECGLTKSVIRAQVLARRWQRVGPRVLVAHNARLNDVETLWVAVLRCGHGATLSHQTAAYLHGLISVAPSAIHVTIPASRRIESPEGVYLHRTRRMANVQTDLPPRTAIADTVLDLADGCATPNDLVALVTRALQRRDVTRVSLVVALESRSRARWRVLLGDLLSEDEAGVESVLEWRFDASVIRAHRLPTPRRQDVLASRGYQRRDRFFEEYGVVIELDGRLGHVGEGAFRDMRRDNAAVRRGEVVLRYGWSDAVGGPCVVAAEIGSVLKARGWKGMLRRCSASCRAR